MTAGWKRGALIEFAELVSTGPFGSMLHKSDYVSDGVPLINPTNIVGETIVADSEKQVGSAALSRLQSYVLRAGDVVVGRRGEIGRCAVVGMEEKGWVCGTGCFFVRPKPALNSHFLAQLLRSPLYRDQLEQASTGATMKNMSNTTLAGLPIAVPSPDEQRRIVAILDEAFEGIATAKANAEKNLQNARDLFESQLQSIFATLNQTSAHARLGDLCERVSVGHVGPTSEFYCDPADGIGFLRSQNVRRGRMDMEGLQYVTPDFHNRLRKSQLKSGDLLFVRVGANRGDCCSVPDDIGALNCANIVFARPREKISHYLELYCQSPHGRSQLLGMTTGAAQGVINTSSVADLVVPIPEFTERLRAVAALDEAAEEAGQLRELYSRKINALDELKKSLLHQAFTGAL